MSLPMMPKATAVWLVENTALSFDQIGEFCGLHALEVKGIADEEVAIGIQGADPIANSQLTQEEIDRCVGDDAASLTMYINTSVPRPALRTKGPKYTPVTKRQERPAAIMWLIRYHPELSDAQVGRLVGTTKPTIASVRERTHWNISNIKPNDPVTLGMCSQAELDESVTKARRRQATKEKREAKERAKAGLPPLEKKESHIETASPFAHLIRGNRDEEAEPELPAGFADAPAPAPAAEPELTADDVFGKRPSGDGE
ncbi:MAG: DUF1013 domain-containing protein [Alphaproteobacteria bacterium]|jgi:uncharacterized protein|nr:DUF1013 domain-containing protein [Alphaproteobacteria bacterium]MBT4020072.1 DUF1013 domain-containing protein [Alphaproteobacteria bacterium]MBT4965352.1 DUF1013 domain-containing protein [Alphaproteobacteria bacterium]MBT5158152.1 DUF1013 domain-containing protein [Alphaproteobacteria bacterium]MBT5918376.1 DUF1013 domain-containing protein [Alphaproteobacteria bacterium]